MNSQTALSTFVTTDVRVKDKQYAPVTSTMTTANGAVQDEIYVNSQPNGQDSTYDDVNVPSKPYSNDEVYVNPEMTDGEIYEPMDRKEIAHDQEPEMYIVPTEMNKNVERDVSPEETKAPTEEELYVNPELKNEEAIYDDTTVLLDDNDDRGYEKMKSGVSINDINAEYVYAVKQDAKTLSQDELYVVPDSEGYKNVPQSHKDKEDEYLALDRDSMIEAYRESQIYSSVQ